MVLRPLSWLLLLVLALLLGPAPRAAGAPVAADRVAADPVPPPAAALLLDGRHTSVDAWPALRMLTDPGLGWGLDELRHRVGSFVPPEVPHANFGVQRQAVWLHLPIDARSADGRWVLQIDYPPLNKVELWQLRDGQLVQHALLGNAQPFGQRPVHGRSHALALELPAGARHELFMRVQTESSMLLPMVLARPETFWAQESAMQMLHGLLAGLALALLLYSLAYWLSLRDALFAHYALMLLGVAVFFISYFGIGQQYLWPANDGLWPKVAPLAILLALVSGTRFVRTAMQAQVRNPRLHRVLGGVSLLAGAGIVASVCGLLDYRQTQLLATALGPVPMLLAVGEGLRLARTGDRIARFMLLGWFVYTVGALSMAGLLRGLVPAGFWTMHVFQFASMLEMVVWLRVLGVRIEDVRRQAERAELEKQALLSLAHTDALTGLPNRRGLNQALDRALQQARPDSALAVFLLDLDGFKPVNDRLGHDVGDELLVQVGQRLKRELRHGDVVARLGGDEFVIMAAALGGEADAQQLGHKLLRAFDLPFDVRGQQCRVGLTIGFAMAPHDGLEPGDLLRRADAAMYAGKQAGRHCVRRGGASAGLVSG